MTDTAGLLWEMSDALQRESEREELRRFACDWLPRFEMVSNN